MACGPVAEMQFIDFNLCAYDMLDQYVATRAIGGTLDAELVVARAVRWLRARRPVPLPESGADVPPHAAVSRSCIRATARDAKGLTSPRSATRPVLYLEHKWLYTAGSRSSCPRARRS